MVALLTLYILFLALATIVEKRSGTELAREVIYNAVWFYALQALLVLSFVATSIKRKMFTSKRWGLLVLHYGFVVILIGAFISSVFSIDGIVHIRKGQSSNIVTDNRGIEIEQLLFEIELSDFTVERYGGSSAASNYRSDLIIDGQHYLTQMNAPLNYGGWKFFQASFDTDEQGTYLSAAYDGVGTAVSYIGYSMLLLGFVMLLVGKRSRFKRVASTLVLFLAVSVSVSGQNRQSEEYKNLIEKFERVIVESKTGRMQSVGSYADDLMRKITKSTKIDNLSSSEVLLGILTNSYLWCEKPLIADTTGELVTFMSLIAPGGEYLLGERVFDIEHTPPTQRNKAQKEVLKFNERVNIVDNLLTGQMFDIFPREGTPQWYSPGDVSLIAVDFEGMHKDSLLVSKIWGWFASELEAENYQRATEVLDMISIYQKAKNSDAKEMDSRIEAELLLVKLNPLRLSGYILMTLGLLLVGCFVALSVGAGRWNKVVGNSLSLLSIVVWLGVTASIVLRWYISGRAPMSSSYETMVFVGWATLLVGLFFIARSRIAFALSVFLCGVLLFVSNLNWMDPQITPLVPVLNSYWLIIHVAVITSSYSFFGVCFLLGVASLVMIVAAPRRLESKIAELTAINSLSATIGLLLLTLGTFIGAVWANESWGRYWGWDPKETWALITMIVYAVLTHIHLLYHKQELSTQLYITKSLFSYTYAVGSVVALGSVLMTFFGVNYFLSGMHSYGGDSAPPALWLIFGIYGFIALLAVAARLCVPGFSSTREDHQ